MAQLIKCIEFDRYLKSIDLSHNQIGYEEIKSLIKNESINEN